VLDTDVRMSREVTCTDALQGRSNVARGQEPEADRTNVASALGNANLGLFHIDPFLSLSVIPSFQENYVLFEP